MGRFDEYMSYFDNYQRKYGDKTTVLYQCGMFYEIYGIDNEQEKLGHAPEIAVLLNVQLTRTDKSILENNRKNPLLLGFPCEWVEKNLSVLVNNGYTVIIVDQVSEKMCGAKKEITREVTRIVSPSTYTNTTTNQPENYLISIYIDSFLKKQNKYYNIGLTAIDLRTGKIFAHQAISRDYDFNASIDETYRFVQTFQPTEIIVCYNNDGIGSSSASASASAGLDLNKFLDVMKDDITVHNFDITSQPEIVKNSYHNHFLKSYYDSGMIYPIEYLNLELFQATTIAFCIMLQFCKDHNKELLTKLHKPIIWDNSTTLILDNNAITQLNLLPHLSGAGQKSHKNSSILNIINETNTNMGARMLKERLLNPIIDQNELNRRYNYVDMMLTIHNDPLTVISSKKQPWYIIIEKILREIADIEQLHRKIETKLLQPTDFPRLLNSYLIIQTLFDVINSNTLFIELFPNELQLVVKDFISFCQSVLNMEEVGKYNTKDITGNFFNRGYNSKLDALDDKIKIHKALLDEIALAFSKLSKTNTTDHVIVKSGEDGHYLHTSKPRYKTIETTFTPFTLSNGVKITSLKDFEIDSKTKTNIKISGNIIDKYDKIITDSIDELKVDVLESYYKFLLELTAKFSNYFQKISNSIAELDVYKSTAKCATLNKYCRPTIIQQEISSFDITNMRHPIVEKIETHNPFISNSFKLAGEGMLLYGINASGKSSTMKAVGIAVIMAQAGFYVAADKLTISPFKSVMTRIIGNDNILKGQSSFEVEMSELRGILNRQNKNALVLGDEICHGTETNSAIALVTASLIDLAKNQVTFIFATHLQQLATMNEITEITNLRQCHLATSYDQENDKLIYNRKLKDGPGELMYGIEVAKAMKLPKNIIVLATEIRKKYFQPESLITHSSYNKDVYIDKCQVPNCNQRATDVHHIKFQSESDQQGFIDHMHKNHKSNLVSLCKEHHDMVHCPSSLELIIFGYNADGSLEYKIRKHLKSLKTALSISFL